MNRVFSRFSMLFLLFSLLLALTGCGGGGVGGPGGGSGSSGFSVSGTLENKVTSQPMAGVTVGLQSGGQNTVSASDGTFTLNGVPVGSQTLVFQDNLGGQLGTALVTISGNTTVGVIFLNVEGNPPPPPL